MPSGYATATRRPGKIGRTERIVALVTEDTARKFRAACYEDCVSMASVLSDLMEEWLEDRERS